MTREEANRVVAEIVDALLLVERFSKNDFKNRWPYHPAIFGELLTQAFDIVRNEHGIEYRPGRLETMFRANYKETLNRSKRQRKAGLNKLSRSAVRADIAAANAPAEERESIEKTASLQKLQLAMARSRNRKRLSP